MLIPQPLKPQPIASLKLVHGVPFSDDEIYWRDHQKWLLDCGYRLRPRYQLDWTPSWKDTGKPSLLYEDSYFLVVRCIATNMLELFKNRSLR
jgi:hypothetical protein